VVRLHDTKVHIKIVTACYSRHKEKGFYCESGETLEQVVQRDGRCPVRWNIKDQVGLGSDQPDLVEDISAHCKGGLDQMIFKGFFQSKLFYGDMTPC